MKPNLLLTLALLSAPIGSTVVYCEDQPQTAAKLDVQIHVEMDYLLSLPKDYKKKESWPLMVFLHGSGERGDNLDLVKKHGPPMLIAAGKEFPMIVVSPQCPKEKSWEPMVLSALLDDLERKYKVDPDRIYLTGLSMGGFGTWRMAAYAPSRLAAIAPICGGAEIHTAKRIAKLPIWAFHGAKDKGVPVELSQSMIEAVKKQGGDPKLTIYPNAEHDSWTETYNNPEFYEWLLAQKRPTKN